MCGQLSVPAADRLQIARGRRRWSLAGDGQNTTKKKVSNVAVEHYDEELVDANDGVVALLNVAASQHWMLGASAASLHTPETVQWPWEGLHT